MKARYYFAIGIGSFAVSLILTILSQWLGDVLVPIAGIFLAIFCLMFTVSSKLILIPKKETTS